MPHMRSLMAAILLLTAALAGCADPQGTDSVPEGPDGGDGGGNATVDPPGNGTLVAALQASAVNGTAPLAVAFNVSAADASANATWELDFGDGNQTNGTALPATANHTFAAGNFSVVLTIMDGNATANASLVVTVLADAKEPPQPVPATTHWTFGPTLGCIEDLAHTCQTLAAGPGSDGVDGHWITLGEAYWGRPLTSTVDKGDAAGTGEWPFRDTDCVFTDADGVVVGEGNNGELECASGAIPAGAEWLFIYPYLTPAAAMTVDVVVE